MTPFDDQYKTYLQDEEIRLKKEAEDIASKPELVGTQYALLSAAWFFSKNCLKKCVDASDTSVVNVTKCVNGGTIGLADRVKHFKEYYALLT